MRAIGSSLSRVGAVEKVTGRARYPGDLNKPGQLYMKILFAGRPHARIVDIDLTAAKQVPGVVAILTAEDVPVNEYGLIIYDQPVLCGDVVRCVADQVACVIAETEESAIEARDKIRVVYEDLPILTDPIAAMHPDAFVIHPERGENNLLCHYKIRNGDVEAAFAEADVIVEGVYHTPFQEHAYLQPEAGLAWLDGDQVVVNVAGQWMHEDRQQIAHALGWPEERVRVEYSAIGGAFGGREDMSVQIVLALAAIETGRPVKIVWTREESIIGHHKRHPMTIRTRWAATYSGRLLGVEAEVIADAGAYAYTSTKVLGNAHLCVTGPYEWPAAKVDSYAVYTNNIPTGAFRGFGAPQGHFAAEMQMNKLAARLGLDPVVLRLKNCLREGSQLTTRAHMPPGVSLPHVIEAAAEGAGWKRPDGSFQKPTLPPSDAPHIKRGIGFACAMKNVGFSFGFVDECWAQVELHGGGEIEEVVVRCAGADVGQGAHTVFCQMAAEAVGVPVERVRLVAAHTDETPGSSGSSSASRMTFYAGNAIRGAAMRALKLWHDEIRPAVGTYRYRPRATTPFHPETGEADPNVSYGFVAEVAEVEVDTELGFVHITRVICADDVGKAINPRLIEGQIEGGVVQAAGYTVLEHFQVRNGEVLTRHLSTYLIPTVYDIPDRVESIILEYPDPQGPWGARGMAEMPFIPLAPAVASAVYDATGIWFDELPLTPDKVVATLHASQSTDQHE